MINQTYFNDLATHGTSLMTGDEVLLLNIAAESTDFARLNHGLVRQAGTVDQAELGVELVSGQRHGQVGIQLSGSVDSDRHRLAQAIRILRGQRAALSEDPYLLINTSVDSSEQITANELPDTAQAIDEIRAASGTADLVGIYTAGEVANGFANSLGQRNWFQTASFNFDWTYYLRGDKAAKNQYAGFSWDDSAFEREVAWSKQQLEALDRTPRDMPPGGYRTYLAPSALEEFVGLLSWYSFGIRAQMTKETPLLQMVEDGQKLAPGVDLIEDTIGGVSPNFQEQGFLRPDRVELITDGQYRNALVSPRSSREYDVPTNGASASEAPLSLTIAPGSAPTDEALARLGTGLYVGNLWYTNFSDRPACRVTGMTRFATFWVEDGEIVAPINVLRFDDTVYNLLGNHLESLDDRAEVIFDPSSYERRSTDSMRMPGAIVSEMRFTL